MEQEPPRRTNDRRRIYSLQKAERTQESYAGEEMNYDEEAYQRDVDKWFEELKDIITNDLLWQHINKYPVKSDYEIKEEDESKDSDDSKE